MITGLGSVIGDIGDKLLPKDLQFLGHIAGGVADFYTGNYAGLVKDGIDALNDIGRTVGGNGDKGIDPPPPKTTPGKTEPTKTDPTKDFFKLSDKDFMKAIESGKIPEDVSGDNKSMLQLQARMNHISEMNALMSNMLKAAHDMRMAVINNIRV